MKPKATTAKSAWKNLYKQIYWLRRSGGISRVCRRWLKAVPYIRRAVCHHHTVAAALIMAFLVSILS